MKFRTKNLLQSLVILILLGTFSCEKPDGLEVTSNYIDNSTDAVGIDISHFNLSWKIASVSRNVKQTAYQVIVANDKAFTEDNLIWDSGKTEGEQSILVPYTGQMLKSGQSYFWKVRVWDNNGNESEWSKVQSFITALVSAEDWSDAQWIAYDELPDENRLVPGIHLPGKEWSGKDLGFHKLPLLRKEFEVKKKLKQALVFVTGLGHYEMSLNGEMVGDHFIAPGWTHYDQTVLYNSYDITSQIREGKNAIGMMFGNGFFIVPNERYRKTMTAYGNPMMIMKLKLMYDDGSEEIVVSDDSWKTTPGPLTFSSIFGGENYDARLEQEGWKISGFDDSHWQNAITVNTPCKELLPEKDYPVRMMEKLEVQGIHKIESLDHAYLYDFGQNASGIFEITVEGNAGDTVVLKPAELRKDDYQANQRATGRPHYYTYVLKGDGKETWHPRFSFTGFRYVQVEGAVPASEEQAASTPKILDLTMIHTRNSSPETGSFETSYELFNRIDTLIKWAIRSNYHSVLSDCPHREKLGWLEQAYLMGEGVHFNYDVYGLYLKIVDDMIAAQTADGLVPDIAPEYTEFWQDFRDSPEWGSASVIVPLLIYKWYGDIQPMKKAWPMMEKYVSYLKSKSEGHIIDYGLGDWYDLGPERPGYAQQTPIALTATAIYFYDVKLMAEVAALIGNTSDIQKYIDWADEIKSAFNKKFFDEETKIYSTGSQTAISMPLVVGLVDEDVKAEVVKSLVESITDSEYALTAGDVGFNFLVKALRDNGQNELLYKMNARDDVPGYGYQLKKGATALTESWQALEIVSNNHLMLGHLMEWFYSGLAGIGQTESSVAYKEVKIEPRVVGGIQSARASYESPYGTIVSDWMDTEEEFTLKVEIPVNSTGVVVLDASDQEQISVNGLPVSESAIMLEQASEKIEIKVGSGIYEFKVKK